MAAKELKMFRLVDNQDIVAEIEKRENGKIFLNNPAGVGFRQMKEGEQPQLGMGPLTPFLDDGVPLELPEERIFWEHKAPTQIANAWRQQFGSGIIVPDSEIKVPKLVKK